MNCTSAGELGGNVALVEDGSVRVGCPGAPGWTTIGVAGSACCAETDSDNKPERVPTARRPPICPRHAVTLISDRRLSLELKRRDFIGLETSSMQGITLPKAGPKRRVPIFVSTLL